MLKRELRHVVRMLGALVAALVAVCGAGLALAKSPAAAATEYKVTFAALVCPSYGDVFANRARNNIQESLEDLGPNSQYTKAGDVVTPAAESKSPQDACDPLVGWKFTLGASYQTQAVNGAWGSLTKVTNPFSTAIVTEASVPELDGHSVATGKTVAGAVTITLTTAQAQLAARADLWVQGGTPADPVLAQEYGGVDTPEYGFAALRCSNDAWNGDNTEYIDFPTGDTHAYCYAIYVTPPPTSGTIIVKKQVTGSGYDANTAFPFNSASLYEPHASNCTGSSGPTCNLSYDPNGFTLKRNGSATFYRGAGQWTIVEGDVAGYDRTAINCASGDGSSTAATDVGNGVTQVQLAAGDTVTCTYVNSYTPPAGLSIFKLTTGGVGRFSFKATRSGGGGSHEVVATTTEPGVPAAAGSGPITTTAGSYKIEETSPQSSDGRWTLTRVDCDGKDVTVPASVKLTAGEVMACTFENHLAPSGSITLHKVTLGATGTAGFTVTESSNPQNDYVLHATTKHEGIAATAVANEGSHAPTAVDLGSYTITESQPAQPTDGTWIIESVVCDNTEVPFENGRAQITLTAKQPHESCTFTDRFIKRYYPPVIPEDPADLKITKTVSPSVVVRGQNITYRLKVTNLGPDPAENVVVNDRPGISPYVVSIHNPTGGKCTVDRAISCYLGTIGVHHSVTLTIVLSTYAWHGKVWNFAVVGGSTPDPNLRNNTARVRVRVKPEPVNLGYLRG